MSAVTLIRRFHAKGGKYYQIMHKDSNIWHLMTQEKVIHELKTDYYKGLTSEEAQKRKYRTGEEIWKVKKSSISDLIVNCLLEPSTILLIVTSLASSFTENKTISFTMLFILLTGILMRVLTELQNEKVRIAAAAEKIPSANVVRDGIPVVLSAGEIVPGDIIFLEPGDTVPCDCRIISAIDSVVSERNITDNSSPVHKYETVINTENKSDSIPCELRPNMLFAGSVILNGTVRAAATACGESTLVFMKNGGIEIPLPAENSEIQRLYTISRINGLIMLGIVLLITILSIILGKPLYSTFICSLAAAVTVLSNVLPLCATVSLSVGLKKSALDADIGRSVILKPNDIKKLAYPDIMIFSSSSVFKSGHSCLSVAMYNSRTIEGDNRNNDIEEILALILTATNAGTHSLSFGNKKSTGRHGRIAAMTTDQYNRKNNRQVHSFPVLDHIDYSNRTAGVDVSLSKRENGEQFCVVSGRIDKVLPCCLFDGSVDTPLTDSRRNEIIKACVEQEIKGSVVIACAVNPTNDSNLGRYHILTSGMIFMGFTACAEEYENNVQDAIQELKEKSIVPVLFSQTPQEDLYYLNSIGLFDANTDIISADQIEAVNTSGMIVALDSISEDKHKKAKIDSARIIIESAHKMNLSVCSVCRTTDDIELSKISDTSFAACDFFRSIKMPLLKHSTASLYPTHKNESGYGGFSKALSVVSECGSILKNMDITMMYIIASQTARITVLLSSLIKGIPLLSPVFVLIWGLIADFIAASSFAFCKHEISVRSKKTSHIFPSYLIGILSGAIIILFTFLCRQFCSINDEQTRALIQASILFAISAVSLYPANFKRGYGINVASGLSALFCFLSGILVLNSTLLAGLLESESSGWLSLVSVLPSLLYLIVMFIYKRFHSKANN